MEPMANLTKEYFDKRLGDLATKDDLVHQTDELKAYTDEKVSELAVMVQRGFESLEKQLDVRKEVEDLKRQMKQVREALHIR